MHSLKHCARKISPLPDIYKGFYLESFIDGHRTKLRPTLFQVIYIEIQNISENGKKVCKRDKKKTKKEERIELFFIFVFFRHLQTFSRPSRRVLENYLPCKITFTNVIHAENINNNNYNKQSYKLLK